MASDAQTRPERESSSQQLQRLSRVPRPESAPAIQIRSGGVEDSVAVKLRLAAAASTLSSSSTQAGTRPPSKGSSHSAGLGGSRRGSREAASPRRGGSRRASKESSISRGGVEDLVTAATDSSTTATGRRLSREPLPAATPENDARSASKSSVHSRNGTRGRSKSSVGIVHQQQHHVEMLTGKVIPVITLRTSLHSKQQRAASVGAAVGVPHVGNKPVAIGTFGNAPWIRARDSGPGSRLRIPKMKTDEVKLKEFFAFCRAGNYRDVKAMTMGAPYLLWLTDVYGFTALHHAAMSSNRDFVWQVLELYHDPHNYVRKVVKYSSDEEFQWDLVALCDASPEADEEHLAAGFHTHEPVIVLQYSRDKGFARRASILPGDVLYMVSKEAHPSRPCMAPEEFLRGVHGYRSRHGWWPLLLEFRGPACSEIIGLDGWTPGHGAAGIGPACKGVLEVLLEELQVMNVAAPKDWRGCTVENWVSFEHEATGHASNRRPLSANAAPTRVEQARLGMTPMPPRPVNKGAAAAKESVKEEAVDKASRSRRPVFGPVEAECKPLGSSDADVFPGIIPRGPPCSFEVPVS